MLRFGRSIAVIIAVTLPSAGVEVRALAGGFENIFRTLQSLPGVTGTAELGSRIAVRGGSPDQNLTVMDGIEIRRYAVLAA